MSSSYPTSSYAGTTTAVVVAAATTAVLSLNSNTHHREQYELNESSTSFILQHSVKLNSEVVFLNGVTLHSLGNYIDYQISNNTLTLTFIPDIGDILLISYVIE
tara:strand:- start:4390 stop:4701 length:312 start_codon:yes stop_codon:yes gene_type:complete